MTRIFAHRGASGVAPENTLEAFALAAKMGADGVELDVHIARDGELVVAHDEKVDRVSDGSGFICEQTTAELKKLRFNRTHPEFADATIPTLREVLELIKPTGMAVNIELKNTYVQYDHLEEKVTTLVASMGMVDRVLYSSFNHHSMVWMKRVWPQLKVGLLYEAIMVQPWYYAHHLGVDALHPQFSELRLAGAVENAHANGLSVNTWTVNDPEDIRFVLDAGADILITNYPDRALAIRDGGKEG